MAVPGKTVALVGNQRHLQRLRQTGVDLIIAPEVLGGQLLVESLMGEEFHGDAVLDTIFSTGAKA